MARKRRGGRRGLRVGKYVNLGFKLVGALVAASPAIRAWDTYKGTPALIPNYVAYYYTGFNPRDGQFDSGTAMQGIGSVVAGIVVAKLGSVLARRF